MQKLTKLCLVLGVPNAISCYDFRVYSSEEKFVLCVLPVGLPEDIFLLNKKFCFE